MWWFQPYECGVVLCRNGIELERTYTARAEYLKAIDGVPEEPNMCDRSVQLSRRVAGLKCWASLKVFGIDAFARAVRNGIRLAEHAQRRIEASSQWTLVSSAQLAVVTFRHADGDGATEAAVARDCATGTTFLATTSVRGQTMAWFCTVNPRTTEDDIDAVLAVIG
jgi:glutamate/tyrosine decarboxylase-like PLP-dependent enzyme